MFLALKSYRNNWLTKNLVKLANSYKTEWNICLLLMRLGQQK